MTRENTVLGGILFTTAYGLVAVVYAIAKYMQQEWGFHPAELTFFNFSIVIVCMMPWVVRRGGFNALKSQRFPLLIRRGVYGFGLSFLIFWSSSLLPLVDVVTLLNTAPLWVTLFAVIVLKEHLSRKSMLCVLGGFIGMLIVMGPRFQGMNFTGDLGAVIAGICMAMTIVVRSKLKEEPWQRVLLYYGLIGVVISAILMARVFKMPQGIQWLFFGAMGVILCVSQALATVALHYAKASVVGPLTYSSIIVSAILGWVVWKHVPTPLTIVGIGLIIVSGILIVLFEAKKTNKA